MHIVNLISHNNQNSTIDWLYVALILGLKRPSMNVDTDCCNECKSSEPEQTSRKQKRKFSKWEWRFCEQRLNNEWRGRKSLCLSLEDCCERQNVSALKTIYQQKRINVEWASNEIEWAGNETECCVKEGPKSFTDNYLGMNDILVRTINDPMYNENQSVF